MANGCLRVRHNFVFIFNFHKTITNKHILCIPKNVKKDGQFLKFPIQISLTLSYIFCLKYLRL